MSARPGPHRRLMTVPAPNFEGEHAFSMTDLDEWRRAVDAYIEGAPDTDKAAVWVLLRMSLDQCNEATTDREAELVRRGIRLGLHLAAFDSDFYAKVANSNRLAAATADKRVLPTERAEVTQLFNSMSGTKTSRFTAIAVKLDKPLDRVRYIIDGPRRKSRKSPPD